MEAMLMKFGFSSSKGPIMKSFDVELGLSPANVLIDLCSGTVLSILAIFSRKYLAPPVLVAVVMLSSNCSLLGPMSVLPYTVGIASTPLPLAVGTGNIMLFTICSSLLMT